MRKALLIPLLLFALLIAPAFAAPYPTGAYDEADVMTLEGITSTHYNVTPGNAIGGVVFTMPIGTNLTFRLGYGASDTIDGEIRYYSIGSEMFGVEYSTESVSYVALGTNSSTSTFWDVTGGLTSRYGLTAHAADEDAGTVGLAVWDTSLLDFGNPSNIAYVPINDIQKKPIYWVDIYSDRPINVDISYGEQSYIQSKSTKSSGDILADWYALLRSAGEFLLSAGKTLVDWAVFAWTYKELFIVLYLSLTGFYAFQKSRNNILRAIGLWFGWQKQMFEFLMSLPQRIVDLANGVKSFFLKII